MTSLGAIERVNARASAGIVAAWRSYAYGLVAAVAAGVVAYSTLRQNGAATVPLVAILAGSAAVALLGLVAFAAVRTGGSTVRFDREGVEYDGFGVLGALREPTSVPYEGVDLAVRTDDVGDRLLGTGTVRLLRSNDSDVVLHHVSDPGAVERALARHVPDPLERFERPDDGSDELLLREPRAVWLAWPDGASLPPSPVVDAAELHERVGLDLRGGLDYDVEDGASDAGDSLISASDFASGNYSGGRPKDANVASGSSATQPEEGATSPGAAASGGGDAGM